MKRLPITLLTLGAFCWCIFAGIAQGQATFRFPPVGGLVMAPDHVTLIASIPSEGKLVYIDTIQGKELKRVEVDFQPSVVAVQGKKLFVGVRGTSKIHVFEVETGKELKAIQLPGEPLEAMSCHPTHGMLYAVNLNNEVYAIDPEKGTHQKTKAKGQRLIVDPSEGKYVYTGIQKPIQDTVFIEEVGNKVKITFGQANARALMLKYIVEGTDLKLVAANNNAAINGRGMAISADGKQVAMAGGGGWRSTKDPRANYAIAVFDTANMKDLKGQIDTGAYPNNIAFHPILNLGAAFNKKEVMVFSAKSFVRKETFNAQDSSFNHSGFLLFGGRGTRVILCSYNAPIRKDSVLEIIPISLTAADHEILNKAFGKATPK